MSKAAVLCFVLTIGASLTAVARADEAGAYVVVVDYTAEEAQFGRLQQLVEGVAKASIGEPGCRRFDVVRPAAPDHLTLYEIFDSKAAFEAHAAAPHFKQFVLDTAAIHASRTAVPGSMVLSLSKP